MIEKKRILITGDAGRGKTTLAQQLSKELNIPIYSTDDFFWKKKFTEKADKEKSIQRMKEIYARESWIVEGTTRHLIEPGFERADRIVVLQFSNICTQWFALLKRYRTRDESFGELLKLMKHVFYKRYKLGYCRNELSVTELLTPYQDKVEQL